MKEKFKNGFLIFLAVLFVGYLLVTGISDLTNKKDLHTVTLDGAISFLEVEHSINGLIPIGKDYYYLGVNLDSMEAYIIKASKRWYTKHFAEDGTVLDAEKISVTALAKKESDYDISKELNSRAAQAETVTFPLGTQYCLNIAYKSNAISKLLLLVLAAFLILAGIWLSKNPGKLNPVFSKIYVVLILIACVLLLKTIL